MANYVRIATFSRVKSMGDIPQGQSVLDFVMDWLDKDIQKVLPHKPDLIVLPEFCDFPDGMTVEQMEAYLAQRGTAVFDYLCGIARDNHCYVAHASIRVDENGLRRNSSMMIDRQGKVIGYYDKNFVTIGEMDDYHIVPSEEPAIFECDFGRVGAVICFDLNFEELRAKYKKLKPDLMLFQSLFGGGLMRQFYAFDVRSYFVSSCGYYGLPCSVISPLGEIIRQATEDNTYIVEDINLDYAVCHGDFNQAAVANVREKYGDQVTIRDPGQIGVQLHSYEGSDKTMPDIFRECNVEFADDYFVRARAKVKENLPE